MPTMTKTTTPRSSRSQPRRRSAAEPTLYPNDVDALDHELQWVEARARRRALAMRIEECARPEPAEGGRGRFDLPDEDDLPGLRRRLRRLLEQEGALRSAIDERQERHRVVGQPVALDRLAALHALGDFERGVLLMAAALALSARFDELFGDLHPRRMGSGLTVESAFAFAELSFAERVARRAAFAPSGPLLGDDLITLNMGRTTDPGTLLHADLGITPRTFTYLIGREGLPDDFEAFSSLEEPRARLEQVVLDEADKRRILSVVEGHGRYLECRRDWGFDEMIRYGRGTLMLFSGAPGTGKTMTAHAVAAHLGKRVLSVDIPTFVGHLENDRFLPGLFREARLHDALLFFDECESLFGDRRAGNMLTSMLLTELERHEGVAILATNLPEQLDPALIRRMLVRVRFPEPDREARREIWARHLPERAPVAADVDLAALADRYDMTGGYIKNAVLMGVAAAVHEGGAAPSITMAMLDRAAREQMARPEDGRALDVVEPAVQLDDVVLSEAVAGQLRELVDAARNRRTVLDRWGVGAHLSYGKGVSALFHGEPGTGKTLAAEAVARELSRPLMNVPVQAVLSKWVGESERNLARIFRDARSHDAVLFLDECDALLAERGADGGARHEDRQVNVLLTLIERHEGVVLMATNRRGALDPALARRLGWVLRFTPPDQALRARIWRGLLPDTVPTEGPLDLDRLAARGELTGGQIKNAVFKAAFRAAHRRQHLSQALLEEAAREALGANPSSKRSIGFSGSEE